MFKMDLKFGSKASDLSQTTLRMSLRSFMALRIVSNISISMEPSTSPVVEMIKCRVNSKTASSKEATLKMTS
jgi:hypothetical protein